MKICDFSIKIDQSKINKKLKEANLLPNTFKLDNLLYDTTCNKITMANLCAHITIDTTNNFDRNHTDIIHVIIDFKKVFMNIK